jgi:hypothetical protein
VAGHALRAQQRRAAHRNALASVFNIDRHRASLPNPVCAIKDPTKSINHLAGAVEQRHDDTREAGIASMKVKIADLTRANRRRAMNA